VNRLWEHAAAPKLDSPLKNQCGIHELNAIADMHVGPAKRFLAPVLKKWSGLPCDLEFFICNFTCNDSVLAVFTRTKPPFNAF